MGDATAGIFIFCMLDFLDTCSGSFRREKEDEEGEGVQNEGRTCYDMEVGENRVRVFYGTEKREGERLEIYTGGISPCSRTVY